MMARRSFLLFGLAVVCGLLAAWLAHNWVRQGEESPRQAQVATQPVLIAAFDIKYGQELGPASLKTIAWPEDSVPDGAVQSPQEVIGKVANQDILRGEPVLRRRVVDQLGGSTLANTVAPDKRAVTVRVNDVIGVAGFLLPGNRVDVMATRMLKDRRADTRILLQDLKVLAVDQHAAPREGSPVVVRAVTLEMDPLQATQLIAATEEGTVQLALRNPTDSAVVAEVEKEAPKPAPRAARPSGNPVTVIRGTTADKSTTRF